MRRRMALSQNFLRGPEVAGVALRCSTIASEDLVYEIGPGEGTLTERLARCAGHVVAVEKDARLVERLRHRFAACRNVTVFLADFLDFPLPATRYKVFANVPFNLTAAIVSRLTEAPAVFCAAGVSSPAERAPRTATVFPALVNNAPEDAYLAVQREAAYRYVGFPRETLVAALLKPWFEPSIVHRFSRRDFVPEPGVDVVLLRLRKRGPPLLPEGAAHAYRDFVTYGFTAWQPSLRRAYAQVFGAGAVAYLGRQAGIDLDVPPTALAFGQWLALFRRFQECGGREMQQRVHGAETRLREQQARLQKSHRTRARR